MSDRLHRDGRSLLLLALACGPSLTACADPLVGPGGDQSLTPGGGAGSGVAGGVGIPGGGAGIVGVGGAVAAGGATATGGAGAVPVGTGGVAAGGSAGAGPTGAEACAPTIPARLVLLSDLQFVNTIEALAGGAIVDGASRPTPETKPFTRKGEVFTTSLLHTRLGLAEDAAALIAAKIPSASGCTTGDDACASTYIQGFAERAFRRPLAPEELTDLLVVYEVGKQTSYEKGLELAQDAIMAAPSATYRTEFGTLAADGTHQLTDSEIASLLSYMLTDGPPDETLLAAARSGALLDSTTRLAEVERLLGIDTVRVSVTGTLMAAWSLGNLFGATKDPNLFPEYESLRGAMFTETELFLRDALWERGAPVEEALTSPSTFVNAGLAELYGVPFTGATPEEFVPVTLSGAERAGFLTHASVLSARSRADNTSVVSRGLFVRGDLLCLPKIPSPPEALIAEVQSQLIEDSTERERADYRGMTQPCLSCHSQFDAFGLALEPYDPIGRFRTDVEGVPIDATVALAEIGTFPASVTGGVELANAAAGNGDFARCLTRHMVVYGTGEDVLGVDSCEVADVLSRLPASGATLVDILRTVVTSPVMTTRATEVSQ